MPGLDTKPGNVSGRAHKGEPIPSGRICKDRNQGCWCADVPWAPSTEELGARVEIPAEDPLATELEGLAVKAMALCHERGWSREWVRAGCYLSLEVSEFVEALRGKRGDPQKEAADILFVLLSTCAGNGVALGGVVARLRELVAGAAVKSLGERGDPAEALGRAVVSVGLSRVLTQKEQHDLREALLAELRHNVPR